MKAIFVELPDKDEADDLTPAQRKTLRAAIKAELEARSKA
jgi:predicted DNA binding protein